VTKTLILKVLSGAASLMMDISMATLSVAQLTLTLEMKDSRKKLYSFISNRQCVA